MKDHISADLRLCLCLDGITNHKTNLRSFYLQMLQKAKKESLRMSQHNESRASRSELRGMD